METEMRQNKKGQKSECFVLAVLGTEEHELIRNGGYMNFVDPKVGKVYATKMKSIEPLSDEERERRIKAAEAKKEARKKEREANYNKKIADLEAKKAAL
jgi:F0F1-type ATP synthase epsilon subunit